MSLLFSICHATARPQGWQDAWHSWASRAERAGSHEYILSMDVRQSKHLPLTVRTAINYGQQSCNAAWNAAAAESSAPIIILTADDFIPPSNWDSELLKAIEKAGKKLTDDFVVWVSTANPHADWQCMTLAILSRARYLKYGYAIWDEYPSVCSDIDFSEMAFRDGVVVDARHLTFEHKHYTLTGENPDSVYSRQNDPEMYRIGHEILERRRAQGFPARGAAKTKDLSIAVCLPGSSFTNEWTSNWTQLFAYLSAHARVSPIFGSAPNPHITRATMLNHVLSMNPNPNLVLWIDHDNLVSPAHFAQLLESLEAHPEADGITGWCWWGTEDNLRLSCGHFDSKGRGQLLTLPELINGPEVQEIGFSGFPCFLMRGETLRKAGRRPFLPILSEEYPWGFVSEDLAFCKAATDRGCRFFVDRRVEVEHKKLMSLRPREELRKTSVA